MKQSEIILKSFTRIRQYLEEKQIVNNLDLQLEEKLILSKNSYGEFNISFENTINAIGKPFQIQNLKSLKEIEDEIVQNEITKFKIQLKLEQGDLFPNFIKVQKVFEEGEEILAHQQGQILIYTLWSSMCEASILAMSAHQSMKQNHQNLWKNKVRFVGISVDESKEKLINKLNTLHFDQIEHFKLNGFDRQQDGIKLFNFLAVPNIVVVGPQGVIQYSGSPKNYSLESNIHSMLQESNQSNNLERSNSQSQSQLNFDSYYDALRQLEVLKYFLNTNFPNGQSALFERVIFSTKKITELKKGKLQTYYSIVEGKVQGLVQFKQKIELVQEKVNELFTSQQIKLFVNIKDPKKQFLEQRNKIIEILKNSGLEGCEIQTSKTMKFDLIDGKFSLSSKKFIGQYGLLDNQQSNEDIQKINKFDDDLHNYGLQLKELPYFENFMIEGIKSKQVGKSFLQIDNLYQKDKQIIEQIRHEEGKILILEFWAPWSKQSVAQMNKNQKLMKENQQLFGDKVQFKALNLNHLSEMEENQIKQNDWGNIQFYHYVADYKQSRESIINKILQIPFLIVVDRKGIINYSSSSSMIDLKERIVDLLQDTCEINKNSNNQQQELNVVEKPSEENQRQIYKNAKYCFRKLIKNASDYQNTFSSLKYQPNFEIVQKKQYIYKNSGELVKVQFTKPEVTYEIRQKDQELIQPLLQKFFDEIGGKNNCLVNQQLLETIDVPIGDKCALCKKELSIKESHYWCYFTKEHLCKECGDWEDDSITTLEKYKYPYNLVYIDIQNDQDLEFLKDIDVYKFGKNTQPEKGQSGTQKRIFQCNSCQNNPQFADLNGIKCGIRWICLNCQPGPLQSDGYNDYCDNCFKIANNDNHKLNHQTLAKFEFLQHKKNHLQLKILFDIGGYWNF